MPDVTPCRRRPWWPSVRDRLAQRLRAQDGSGPVTAIGGVAMFLVLLFVATQTMVHLAAGTRAGAIALEAASRGARADTDPCATALSWGAPRVAAWDATTVTCHADGETVRVAVRGPSPAGALAVFGVATGLDTLDRSAVVRRETFR